MRDWDIIEGGRLELELELLKAMFTPGAESRVRNLGTRLARRQGKLRLVVEEARGDAPPDTDPSPDPCKD